jgi:DNA-binding NarL/FixJ family response regulator
MFTGDRMKGDRLDPPEPAEFERAGSCGTPRTRLAIVASVPLLREGLPILFAESADLVVDLVASTFEDLPVDVHAEVDAVLALVHGVAVLRSERLQGLGEHPHVRLVGTHDNLPPASIELLRTGGFDVLVDIGAGHRAIIEAVVGARSRTLMRWEAPRVGIARLTDRERAVMTRIAKGANSREIAAELGISAHTVENYKQRVFRKLGVANQAQAVATALRHGLLGPALDYGRDTRAG